MPNTGADTRSRLRAKASEIRAPRESGKRSLPAHWPSLNSTNNSVNRHDARLQSHFGHKSHLKQSLIYSRVERQASSRSDAKAPKPVLHQYPKVDPSRLALFHCGVPHVYGGVPRMPADFVDWTRSPFTASFYSLLPLILSPHLASKF
jgi:hypothetical protein